MNNPQYEPDDQAPAGDEFRFSDGATILQGTPQDIAAELGISIEEAIRLMGGDNADRN